MDYYRYGWLLPILIIGGWAYVSRRLMTRRTAKSPELRLGAIARTLGLRLVEGDPEHNLAVGVYPGLLKSLLPWQRFDVLMEGSQWGHALSLRIQQLDVRIRVRGAKLVDHHRFSAELRVTDVQAPAPFDVRCQAKGAYVQFAPESGLELVRQGEDDASWWTVATPSAELVPALVEWLDQSRPLLDATSYLHVAGGEDGVAFVIPYSHITFIAPHLPAMLDALVGLVRRIGARRR